MAYSVAMASYMLKIALHWSKCNIQFGMISKLSDNMNALAHDLKLRKDK